MNMRGWIIHFILASFILAPMPLRAETLKPDQDLSAAPQLLDHLLKGYQEIIAQNARDTDKQLGQQCATNYQITVKNIFVLETVDWKAGDKLPKNGAWQYRYDAQRCGNTRRYNLILAIQKNGSLAGLSLPPGDTVADFRLIKDAAVSAIVAAADRTKGCQNDQISDTRVIKLPEPGEGWEEIWTIQVCDKPVDVNITFTPDGVGGTYFTARLKK